MVIKTSHFLAALMLATTLHAGVLYFVSLAPRRSTAGTMVIRIDLAALGEPEAVRRRPALPPRKTAETEPKPRPIARPEPPPPPRPEPKPQPELTPPKTQPEPIPQPETQAKPPATARDQEVSTAAVSEPGLPRPRKGIVEGVSGGKSESPDLLSRYMTTLFRMIDAKKHYPTQSLRKREEGTVVVRVTLAPDGKLIDVMATTERPRRLVEASLKAVQDAAPFPPFAEVLDQKQVVFEVPVVYRIR